MAGNSYNVVIYLNVVYFFISLVNFNLIDHRIIFIHWNPLSIRCIYLYAFTFVCCMLFQHFLLKEQLLFVSNYQLFGYHSYYIYIVAKITLNKIFICCEVTQTFKTIVFDYILSSPLMFALVYDTWILWINLSDFDQTCLVLFVFVRFWQWYIFRFSFRSFMSVTKGNSDISSGSLKFLD